MNLLDELLFHLHEYCDELYFEAGGHPNGIQELIITAEGKIENFEKVEKLISQAPILDNWNFISFIPPRNSSF